MKTQLLTIGLLIGFGITVAGGQTTPRSTSVAMGKSISYRLTSDVKPESVRVTVVPRQVARGRLDTNRNRFVIDGLVQGTARVTFTGTYRLIAVAGRSEQARSFRHVFDVTVLPPNERTDSRVLNIQVSKGSHKDFKLEYLMGAAFAKSNEEGYRWRKVSFADGNGNVAEGLLDTNQLKFRVSGINHGKTVMVLRGERSEGGNGVWQRVVREIRVQVGTGIGQNDPGADADPNEAADDAGELGNEAAEPAEPEQTSEAVRDQYVAAVERNFDQLKSRVAQASSDPSKRQAVSNELTNFLALVEAELEKEKGRRPPNQDRISKIENLIRKTRDEISGLSKNSTSSKSLAEIWSAGIESRDAGGSRDCPANPNRELLPGRQTVYYGVGKYFIMAGVCVAAVHAGKITFERGGTVRWEMTDISMAEEQAAIAAGPQPRNGVAAAGLFGSCSKCAFVFVD